MDITAASTERTIHIRICHHLWIRAFNMYIFKIPGFYECPISWVHFSLRMLIGQLSKRLYGSCSCSNNGLMLPQDEFLRPTNHELFPAGSGNVEIATFHFS